jgi:hypothetical protein
MNCITWETEKSNCKFRAILLKQNSYMRQRKSQHGSYPVNKQRFLMAFNREYKANGRD